MPQFPPGRNKVLRFFADFSVSVPSQSNSHTNYTNKLDLHRQRILTQGKGKTCKSYLNLGCTKIDFALFQPWDVKFFDQACCAASLDALVGELNGHSGRPFIYVLATAGNSTIKYLVAGQI
jgi:hypothetical protein